MKKAIGYVRVSTSKQAIDGVSIEAQSAKIKQWASFHDYELVHIFIDEGISGKKIENRPALLKALQALESGMAFVFYSLSRISRNTIETIKLGDAIAQKGADLVSLTEKIDTTGAAGRMIFNLLAVLNQFERDQVSERTKFALNHLKDNDQVYSPIPYGFDAEDGKLILNIAENDNIKLIQLLYENDGYGFRKIATTLNKAQIRSKKGGIWYAKTVEQVYKRSRAKKQ